MISINTKARQALCDKFLSVLEKGYIPWEQLWVINSDVHQNAITKVEYTGLTNLILNMEDRKNPNWVTKSQATKKGWVLKEDARPVIVEKFLMRSKEDPRKEIEIDEFLRLAVDKPNLAHYFDKVPVAYYLYNIDDIKNVPEKYKKKQKKVSSINKKKIHELPSLLHVGIVEGKDDMAFYMLSEDAVHIPAKSSYKSEYSYLAVKLHELCHATGNAKRLDRSYLYKSKADYEFGSEGYAREELRAEIASAFLMQDLGLEPDKKELTNHMGYVQSWVKILQREKKELSLAIDDAYRIESYILDKLTTRSH